MTTPHLVLFDADHIKEYVFATGRLKEIRGASEQVRRLTDYRPDYRASTFTAFDLQLWQPGADTGVIYASGGAGAVLFADKDQAVAFCTALERDFRWQTASATLSAIWEPVDYASAPQPVRAEAEAQKRAAQKLARRKASRPQAELIPGGGALRFCASDRLHPVSSRIREVEGEALFASESTANKRFHNFEYRNPAIIVTSPFWQAFEQALQAKHTDTATWLVYRNTWRDAIQAGQDLSNLSAYARPKGYVALVYVDGDGVGKRLRSAVTQAGFRGYQEFSQALTYAATQATAEALANAYARHPPAEQDDPDIPGQKQRFLPFEVITIGGDDVILLCTGEHGLAIAQHICERFQPLLDDYYVRHQYAMPPELPTASAGVVIAHDSLPVVQLERRGRELLKSAKRRDGGGIDFHIVSTPALAEISTVRDQSYRFGMTGLTSRPYERAVLQQLLRYARYLCGLCDLDGMPLANDMRASLPTLPTSKRADLYRACYAERIQATFDVLTMQMRLRSREREALKDVLLKLGYGRAYPFRHDADRDPPYHTALIDLLEIMEFVAEEGQWASAAPR